VPRHLLCPWRSQVNFDHPDSLDSPLLVSHLHALRSGQPVDVPVYNYATHTRETERQEHMTPARIILVEGILIFADREVASACDIKIFVDTEPDLRFIRRLRRDIAERGRGVDDVIRQYQEVYKPTLKAKRVLNTHSLTFTPCLGRHRRARPWG
jgi:uridine kinase